MGALGARPQLQNCHLPLGAFVFTALPTGTGPAILSSQQENFLDVLMQEAMVIQSLFTSQRKGFRQSGFTEEGKTHPPLPPLQQMGLGVAEQSSGH